jgi:hypothetical protein
MSITDKLTDAYHAHADALPQFGWPSEIVRWMELLVCFIHQSRETGAIEDVREALTIWQKLDLIAPARLVGVTPGSEEEVILLFTLKQHGFDSDEAKRALSMAIETAQAVAAHYGGKIQRCLRVHAIALRDELMRTFEDTGLNESKLRYAVTHWLQNTTNAPISLEHESMLAFCRDNEIDMDALRAAADELDINLSQLDDLFDLQAKRMS